MKRRHGSNHTSGSTAASSLEEENNLLKKELLALKQELFVLRKHHGEPQRGWGGSWHPPSLSWSALRAPLSLTSSQQQQHQQQQQQQQQQASLLPNPAPNTLPSRLHHGNSSLTLSVASAESGKPRKKVPLSPPPIRNSAKHSHHHHHQGGGGRARSRKDSDYDDYEVEVVNDDDDDEVFHSDGGNISEDVEAHFGAAGLHHRNITLSPQRNNKNTISKSSKNNNNNNNNNSNNAATKLKITSDIVPIIRRSSDSRLKDDDSDDGVDDSDHVSESEPKVLLLVTDEEGGETTFGRLLQDRAGWLVGLLVLQSMSSFILARNEALLQRHLVIVRFLTMLVGAGGNAGNQASVRVIRGLAVGTVNSRTIRPFLRTEMIMALCLSSILGVAGCLRAAVFLTPWKETVAITSSLCMIVLISIVLGCLLPLLMKRLSIDPAHSSTTIQVIMDILGVCITVWMSTVILGSTTAVVAAAAANTDHGGAIVTAVVPKVDTTL